MKGWISIFSLLIVGTMILYYFLNDSNDRFSSYQYTNQTNRNPAADPTEGDQQRSSAILPEVELESEKSERKGKESKSSIQLGASIKALDSRKIAAQSRIIAQNVPKPSKSTIYRIQGEDYSLVEDTFAVLKRDWDEDDPQIVGEFLGHYLVKSYTPIADSNPVMIEQNSKSFAIVTKVLKVKLIDLDRRDEIFTQSYQVVEEYPHINVVLYKFNDLDQMQLAAIAASQNPEVLRSTIEILKGARAEQ